MMNKLNLLLLLAISSKALAEGNQVFTQVCAACHQQGMLGAPKFGSIEEWVLRIKEGKIDLIAEAYVGVRAMPPKGGQPDLSLEEFSSAAIYMANAAGANWQIPTPQEYQKIKKIMARKVKLQLRNKNPESNPNMHR